MRKTISLFFSVPSVSRSPLPTTTSPVPTPGRPLPHQRCLRPIARRLPPPPLATPTPPRPRAIVVVPEDDCPDAPSTAAIGPKSVAPPCMRQGDSSPTRCCLARGWLQPSPWASLATPKVGRSLAWHPRGVPPLVRVMVRRIYEFAEEEEMHNMWGSADTWNPLTSAFPRRYSGATKSLWVFRTTAFSQPTAHNSFPKATGQPNTLLASTTRVHITKQLQLNKGQHAYFFMTSLAYLLNFVHGQKQIY